MIANEQFAEFAQSEPALPAAMQNVLPIPFVESEDVSSAVAFLVSDSGRYITGIAMPVDAGCTIF
jgi:NAD(P)-dependent dehydrogenase (short-subunit alcohol dehydrogenase family)